MYKRLSICVKDTYIDKKDNQQKTKWNKVGQLVVFEKPGEPTGYKLEMFMFPTTPFAIFEDIQGQNTNNDVVARRQAKSLISENKDNGRGYDYPSDEIKPEDIPF